MIIFSNDNELMFNVLKKNNDLVWEINFETKHTFLIKQKQQAKKKTTNKIVGK